MATNEYHFITTWQLPSTVGEITEILSDPVDLMCWWPSVYLDVEVTDPGDANGVGKTVKLYTKGWLPYTLRWHFHITAIRPDGSTLVAHGDFEGRGIWTFKQVGDQVDVIYDWKIDAEKPLLKTFSFIMKPLFSANHHWAMRMGEESLRLELARRHAATPEERAKVPPPPQPTPNSPIGLLRRAFGRSSS